MSNFVSGISKGVIDAVIFKKRERNAVDFFTPAWLNVKRHFLRIWK